MALLPVAEALAKIVDGVKPLAKEPVVLTAAQGRILAEAVKARRDQPPFAASAMDGYALRAADLATLPADLKLIGLSQAGRRFNGTVGAGEAVRIFTGAPVPLGADTVVIQENTGTPEAGRVRILQTMRAGGNIRGQGLDFRRGEVLLPAGLRLGARDIGLAAAANAATLRVRRQPLVGIFATGDELIAPGGTPNRDQIVSSNSYGLMLLAEALGARVKNYGIVRDSFAATRRAVLKAGEADVLVTTGGASVGDHDHVRAALLSAGVKLDFWKIAMRPGKPFMYGRRGRQHVMGLPGNPVSALVCARLFLKPLLLALAGLPHEELAVEARLEAAMPPNDLRQDYVRATLSISAEGGRRVRPFPVQDSSMMRTFREADCLIIRPPFAPEAASGSLVPVLLLDF